MFFSDKIEFLHETKIVNLKMSYINVILKKQIFLIIEIS